MPSYTDTFGGNTIAPTFLSYAALTMTASQVALWPKEGQQPTTNQFILPQKLDVTPNAGLTITLPSAVLVSVGKDLLIRNVGANSVSVVDSVGGAVATVAAGEAWYIVLRTNAVAAGTWYALKYGVGSSTADAAALAGLGLVAITTTLNQSHPYNAKASTPYTVLTTDRAQSLVWTGGAGTFNFTAAATLGNTWFTLVRNAGSGDLTLDPNGAETIDGAATLTLLPTESLIVLSDGSNLYTLGRGRSIVSTVTAVNISVNGGTDSLTPTEVAAQVQTYTGALLSNQIAEYGTGAGYWVARNNTSGAFTLIARVNGADPGVLLPQGVTVLLRSDGTNLIWGHDPLVTTGIVARTSASPATANPFTARTLTGTADQITVTNGTGVAGNPTFSLPAAVILPGSLTASLGALTFAPANANFNLSPTGTGTGTIAPATAGTINNMSIGATTRRSGAFTTLALDTDLPLTEGGTGASTAAGARTNLGIDDGVLLNVQVFTASGTWTPTAGTGAVVVEVVGGGGGGGAGATGGATGGVGGGGGGTSIERITSGLGGTETVTIGAGGAGGTGAGGNGAAGGTSSFGAHCSATGGAGGTGSAGAVIGAAGGGGSGGTVNMTGASSDPAGATFSSSGGASTRGGGGTGQVGGVGGTGGNYGGGGGGARGTGIDNVGGPGAAGIVIVWEYLGT